MSLCPDWVLSVVCHSIWRKDAPLSFRCKYRLQGTWTSVKENSFTSVMAEWITYYQNEDEVEGEEGEEGEGKGIVSGCSFQIKDVLSLDFKILAAFRIQPGSEF
ncbi:hypothetical protein HHUSO_G29522 [Huso huso]|uniref:SKICH domain-containing protein n=1 Tax=Huso huso TaxID=61971 RepID=A0ABR0YG22_HUSHU